MCVMLFWQHRKDAKTENVHIIITKITEKETSKMKLILAIVNNDDAPIVTTQLTKAGFNTTKIASTGGFLMSGNTTFITGVDDDKVDSVIDIISRFSKKRMQPSLANTSSSGSTFTGATSGVGPITEVLVGGGTIFVMNIERFEHV